MKIKQDVKRVYVIQNREFNRIKIGVSKDVEKRLNALMHSSGCDLKILYSSKPIYDYLEVEKKLHILFSEHRIRGEWFSVNPKTVINRAVNLTSKKQTCRITKHYENGKNASEIARLLNVSRSGVVKYLKSIGYSRSNDKTLKIESNKIIKRSSFLSKEQIKEMVNKRKK